jgi:hypothetical protein
MVNEYHFGRAELRTGIVSVQAADRFQNEDLEGVVPLMYRYSEAVPWRLPDPNGNPID